MIIGVREYGGHKENMAWQSDASPLLIRAHMGLQRPEWQAQGLCVMAVGLVFL